jgi:hypothetical protein
MLRNLKKAKTALTASLLIVALSGCASEPRVISDYCLIDERIIPTNAEIDKAINADLVPLLLRIDEHDTRYEDVCNIDIN